MQNGVHQGVDTITDFHSNDIIDLRDFFKGAVAVKSSDSVIHFEDTEAGTVISAKLGTEFVDVALLQGVHIPLETTVASLASDGFCVL